MVKYSANGAASIAITLAQPLTEIKIKAKSSSCQGVVQHSLCVDEATTGNIKTTTRWATYILKHTLPAGSHTVEIVYINDFSNGTCDRTLFLDTLKLELADNSTGMWVPTASQPPSLHWVLDGPLNINDPVHMVERLQLQTTAIIRRI